MEMMTYSASDIFGNEVLDGGGEVAFMAIIHMPLVFEDFDYGERISLI